MPTEPSTDKPQPPPSDDIDRREPSTLRHRPSGTKQPPSTSSSSTKKNNQTNTTSDTHEPATTSPDHDDKKSKQPRASTAAAAADDFLPLLSLAAVFLVILLCVTIAAAIFVWRSHSANSPMSSTPRWRFGTLLIASLVACVGAWVRRGETDEDDRRRHEPSHSQRGVLSAGGARGRRQGRHSLGIDAFHLAPRHTSKCNAIDRPLADMPEHDRFDCSMDGLMD